MSTFILAFGFFLTMVLAMAVGYLFQKKSISIGAKDWKSCRSRKMLKNEYLVAKFCFDTAENEPCKV